MSRTNTTSQKVPRPGITYCQILGLLDVKFVYIVEGFCQPWTPIGCPDLKEFVSFFIKKTLS